MEADKYEVLEKIGQGSFGVIRKVRRKIDGHILCRKEINYLRMSPKEREQLQAELAVLKGLRHPNIVAYYEREHIKSTMDLHIYMEYCEHGDLAKRIKHMHKVNLMAEEDFVWSVFAQLVTALYRCHYGEGPPEVGRNVIGLGSDANPIRSKASHTMILHRDLKPENIFLGSDSTVKLGDFGLSKIMASHDFASTYVGTPFYMSPEICAAEQYSLFSDIWAFGCIMYELCAKEPPFNARTHLELIQKIRLGRVKPLSSIYSVDLQDTILSCLRVNPSLRPDTAQLLNLPMVKLKRKEMEVVALGKHMKVREDLANRKLKDIEQQLASQETWRETMRAELDNSLRREWEVKARLEIDRQVQQMTQKLYREFEVEVDRRVKAEVERQTIADQHREEPARSSTPDPEDMPNNLPYTTNYRQSQSTTGEVEDFLSSTDLSELSMDSPTMQRKKPLKRSSRTPFTRAHTMFDGSPMDVSMAEPSPAPIASLGLSPRRSGNKPVSQFSRNIFAAVTDNAASRGTSPASLGDSLDGLDQARDEEDEDDNIVTLPSPTRPKSSTNDPFKALGVRRPGLLRQKTAPPQKFGSQPTLFGAPSANTRAGTAISRETRIAPASNISNGTTSPIRRQTKLPSVIPFISNGSSPQRKGLLPTSSPSRQAPARPLSRTKNEVDIRQTALLNSHNYSHTNGRTLVELAQARLPTTEENMNGMLEDTEEFSTKPIMKKASSEGAGSALNKDRNITNKMAGERTKSASAGADGQPGHVAMWDPEHDEMPSPFLVRGVRGINILHGAAGGPGLRHLR